MKPRTTAHPPADKPVMIVRDEAREAFRASARNHVHMHAGRPSERFHRILDGYLRTNHGRYGTSGRLTGPQRRRLWKNFPEEMQRRRHELGAAGMLRKGWV